MGQQGWRLHSIIEQDKNTIIVFERMIPAPQWGNTQQPAPPAQQPPPLGCQMSYQHSGRMLKCDAPGLSRGRHTCSELLRRVPLCVKPWRQRAGRTRRRTQA